MNEASWLIGLNFLVPGSPCSRISASPCLRVPASPWLTTRFDITILRCRQVKSEVRMVKALASSPSAPDQVEKVRRLIVQTDDELLVARPNEYGVQLTSDTSCRFGCSSIILRDGIGHTTRESSERVNEELIRLPEYVQPIFHMFGIVLVDVHRALGHREKRLRRLDILGHLRGIQSRGHLLEGLEFIADAPDHEVNIRPQADGGITVEQQPRAKIRNRANKLVLAFCFSIATRAMRAASVEREVYKRRGTSILFSTSAKSRESQRTTHRITGSWSVIFISRCSRQS